TETPTCARRPGADVPELSDILRRGDWHIATGPQGAQPLANGRMMRVRAVEQPQEDAAVGKSKHQSWSEYISAREKSVGRAGRFVRPSESRSSRCSNSARESSSPVKRGPGTLLARSLSARCCR